MLIFLMGLLQPSVSAGADVYVSLNRLTVKVQDEPLEPVLRALARQAEFELMIVQMRDFIGVTISEEFQDLSIEEGIHRLLPATGTTA